MAEFSDNQFSWVNWLTTTTEIPLADATVYSNNLMNYGVETLEHLQNELNRGGNFLVSPDIGVKKGHANRIKDALTPSTPQEPTNPLPVTAMPAVVSQAKALTSSSILLPGRQGHHDVIRKVVLACVEGAVDSLRHEYAMYGRLAATDTRNNHFPRIYGLEENFPLPTGLQSKKTGTTGLSMMMELGESNFFEFVDRLKGKPNMIHQIQEPLSQIFYIIAAVHQCGLVWMDFKPQNVVEFESGIASRQF